ncbi:MAG: hypothetical protein KDN20_12660 [Verrucomicrobiae bacterium]|nr:hypothetical protein [Verrucomicrobiae bacterium]
MHSGLKAIADLSEGIAYLVFWIIPAFFASIHVYRDCRKLGEKAGLNISGTFILWPLYYLGWILWWPGSLRLWLTGRSVDDLTAAKNVKRLRDRQGAKSGKD